MSKVFSEGGSARLLARGCAALILLCSSASLMAARSITLPHEEHFDNDTYTGDILWVEDGNGTTDRGATHTWEPLGGWSGGAAKFTPPTTYQGYAGLGQFTGMNTPQLNVRFLIYHGSTWLERAANNKVIIMNRIMPDGSAGDRPMIISHQYDNNEFVSYGACDGTVCNYQGGGYWPDGTDDFRIGNPPNNREEEWICVEFEGRATDGVISLYITTQDGVLNGLYTQQTMAQPGGTFRYIDILGGYMDYGNPDENTYFKIDELKVDDSYIGCPDGFVTGTRPKSPTSLIAQ